MVYKCPRCNVDFEIATNLRNHLNRKNKCIPILQDIDIKDIIIENCKIEEDHNCEYCGISCSNKYNLNRHLKSCNDNDITSTELLKQQLKEKDKQMKEQLKEKDKQMKEQIKEKDRQTKEQLKEKDKQIEQLIKKAGNTVNNTTITNNNTIVLLSFDNADRSHLTDEKKYYLLCRKFMSIPYLIKEIYFNPNVPQNHSIKLNNMRDNLISLHIDNKWIKTDKNELIEKLLDSNERYLEDWANDSIEQYPDALEKFQDYLEIKENDEEADKKLKHELELLIYNKGKIYV
jgi:hypothetical protein